MQKVVGSNPISRFGGRVARTPRRGRGVAATIRAPRLVTLIAFVAAVLGSVILAAIAQAAPGDLDPTFSGNGEQTTDFGGSSEAKAVVVQPDGKTVVGREGRPAIPRLRPRSLQPQRHA